MMMLINISTNCATYPKISKLPDSASLNLNSSLLFSCHCHCHGIPSYHQLMVKILKVPIQQSVRKPPIPFWDVSKPKQCTANPKIAHHHPLHSISRKMSTIQSQDLTNRQLNACIATRRVTGSGNAENIFLMKRKRMHMSLLKKGRVILLVYSMAPIQTMVMPGSAIRVPNSISYVIIIHLLNTPLFQMSTSKAWVASKLKSMVPGLSLSQ